VKGGAARWRVAAGGALTGSLTVPGDKSISHRALMLGALAHGETSITGFLAGEDCLATLNALRSLGVTLQQDAPDTVRVQGAGATGFTAPQVPLDMGNAGTAMRLMMGLLAGQGLHARLIGDASLMRRPMERVATPLRLMGADVRTQGGKPPVEIAPVAGLHGIDYALPVASAQVKSALLLAALDAVGVTRLKEPAPTRDHTERMLQAFGVELSRAGSEVALAGGQHLTATRLSVPADFSSAAFFLVAGVLAAPEGLTVTNVGINPTRTGLLELLRLMGAEIRVQPRGASEPDVEPVADITVRASRLRGIEAPAALIPLAIDELPVFFIAAACAEGDTLVQGASELRVKESDRLSVMAEGLARLGVEHRLLPDGLWIRGRGQLGSGRIDSHGDHRIAMAFAVAALRSSGPIEIADVANVATSFPGFVETARRAGLAVEPL
jgi:3-phosphoshikimate 1-carboxyvinyltransferase